MPVLHQTKVPPASTIAATAARSRPIAAARAGSGRAGWRRALGLLPIALALLSFASCTLTSEEFEPARVEPQPNQPVPSTPDGVTVCAAGLECCAELPCSGGQSCSAGYCQPVAPVASSDAGPSCQGEDCPRPEQLAPVVNCVDETLGLGETDTDCGGSCGSTCQAGQRCQSDADCSPGLACPSANQRCTPPSCSDGALNGSELQIDCGGGTCPGCLDGTVCSADTDCQSQRCGNDGRCAAPSCTDSVANGSESAEDCGGDCAACGTGSGCNAADDCLNGVCLARACAPGIAQCCQPRSCNDDVRNGLEADVDCGGPCPDCATGGSCNGNADCQSGVCGGGGCAPGVQRCCQAPSCNDGVTNGNEPVPDCGNVACGLCALADLCTADAQCQSGFCQAGRCADPGSCTDGALNGTETSTDCGGSRCQRCADRLQCTQDSDCNNNNCFNNVCISCGSGVADGTETDIDCGGGDPACQRCQPGRRCLIGSDCQGGTCFGGFC